MSKSINLYATIEDLQGIISQIPYKGITLGFCYTRFYKTEEIKEIIDFSEIEKKQQYLFLKKMEKYLSELVYNEMGILFIFQIRQKFLEFH